MPNLAQPLSYTADPTWLAVQDIWLFLRITITWPISSGLPSVIFPLYPYRSGKLDELYPDPANIWAIVLHLFLFLVQAIFILSLVPSTLFGVPFSVTPLFFGTTVGFIFANKYFCILLNGTKRRYISKIDPSWPKHDGEKWIFINGVAVGDHWMQSNLDRLALMVRRPIHGIHNKTCGVIFDTIECIIQRTFGYATKDIRDAYASLVETLGDTGYSKIVLILHSQGAVEGGLALDWLYATIDREQLAKIEVYTFGSAANHFNSPVGCALEDDGSISEVVPDERVIKHIEHYANAGDYVSKFGILHFRPLPQMHGTGSVKQAKEFQNRYFGRLFIRKGTGHQLNANYLDDWFTMDKSLKEVKASNVNMDAELDEELLDKYDVACKVEERDLVDGTGGDGSNGKVNGKARPRRNIKDVSRLWLYRNGQTPPD